MNRIQETSILGVNIAVTNIDEILKFLSENMKEVSGNYICVSNVHTTVLSYEDSDYKKVQNNALLRLPDGAPLSSVARKKVLTKLKE